MKLTVELLRDRDSVLRSMDGALDDTRPILRDLATDLRRGFDRQFASGSGWPGLLGATLRRKRGNGILQDRGDLRRSLTVRGAPNSVERYGRDEVLVGTTDPAAGPLQRGARGMPPRDPVRFDRGVFATDASRTVVDHLLGRGGGLRGRLGL